MRYIVVDLEMNPLAKEYPEERKQCRSEIIQIGAVALDERFQEISSFKTLVKPQYNSVIMPRIEKLTGIKTDMVREAPQFPQAVRQFFSWCIALNDDIQIQQWSDADHSQMIQEINLKRIELTDQEQAIMEDWQDFQHEFGKKLGVSDRLSLKNAIMYAGVDMVGYYHDALYDARNTATLFEIVRTPDKCKKALDLVISALNPAPHHTTLGDLFNFSELAIIS